MGPFARLAEYKLNLVRQELRLAPTNHIKPVLAVLCR